MSLSLPWKPPSTSNSTDENRRKEMKLVTDQVGNTVIIRCTEWGNWSLEPIVRFLQAAANGGAKVPLLLLKIVGTWKESSFEKFADLIHKEQLKLKQSHKAALALRRESKNRPKLPPMIRVKEINGEWHFSWTCRPRNKHSPEATDRAASDTRIILTSSPSLVRILVISTNKDSLEGRVKAVVGNGKTPTAINRILGNA
jgi:hypothetical protein